MEEIVKETPVQEEPQYSAFRYGLGAVLAFFGISSKTHRASKKRAKLVGDIFTYVILLFGGFLAVYPFWWMIAGSFAYTADKTLTGVANELVWWPKYSTFMDIPDKTMGAFGNYQEVFTNGLQGGTFPKGFNFWRGLINNLVYSIVPVVVGVITSASAAFSFAKIEWIGRDIVFFFLLAAIMVPGPSIMISQYVMYGDLNWRSNGLVLIIPGMFGSIMTAFFIRQFLFGLPTSIIEAAKIDGAGYFRIFIGFILPLAMPAIMAQGLLSFMGCWNNYMGSYIMIQKSVAMNLPHAMYLMSQNDNYSSNNGPIIAASVILVVPVLILFACFQKTIINSLMLTGSKE